jgi:MerR family transcriptional regulator, heat shock protein HspR
MDPRDDFDEPKYVISVAARLVDLHPQTLRHYEHMGLVAPSRTDGNIRLYSQRDVERLRRISRLIDDLGVNLAGVEVILRMNERMEQLQREMDSLEAAVAVERRAMREKLSAQIYDVIQEIGDNRDQNWQRLIKELKTVL